MHSVADLIPKNHLTLIITILTPEHSCTKASTVLTQATKLENGSVIT